MSTKSMQLSTFGGLWQIRSILSLKDNVMKVNDLKNKVRQLYSSIKKTKGNNLC